MTTAYKKAGVDDRKAEALVKFIRERAGESFKEKMAGDIGFFAGFVPFPFSGGKDFLVAGCDGVGTKILIAKALEKYDTIGIDLVAMNSNDVAVCGAKPLLFLDYLAVGKLKIEREKRLLEGIIRGCEIAQCALVGGETAQMPDVYSEDDFDLAGFCVGVVKKDRMLGPLKVREGDVLLGIGSNGLHSNGFSLVRKIFFPRRYIKKELLEYRAGLNCSLGEELLRPTYIYSPLIINLVEKNLINAAAHITGGGIPGNLVRVLPENMDAEVYTDSWNVPHVFYMIQESGKIKTKEMFNVFNMGIGLILCVSEHNKLEVSSIVKKNGFRIFEIGFVRKGKKRVVLVKKNFNNR
ncbi:MAG: phosphoribosylformylglycinamidine cyclo-ligase [Candidatus Omnitrophica bacterium]|nr:phosphoribosylformylglycinamidine cyclo-ligase [Candidatus Omnitrophota bacterium]